MVSCPRKKTTRKIYYLTPHNLRCRLSVRREPHLVANFAPVLSAEKKTSVRRDDNNDNNTGPRKFLSERQLGRVSKLANKLIPPPKALRIRAFCCGLHWLKYRGGRVMVSHGRWDSFLFKMSSDRHGCFQMSSRLLAISSWR